MRRGGLGLGMLLVIVSAGVRSSCAHGRGRGGMICSVSAIAVVSVAVV